MLDHHEPKSALPDCVAVVNPKAEADCAFQYLCSVGIVFKLCHALLKTRPLPEFDLKANLDLVALGTVADIVPLQHENRIFVQRGMRGNRAIEASRPSEVDGGRGGALADRRRGYRLSVSARASTPPDGWPRRKRRCGSCSPATKRKRRSWRACSMRRIASGRESRKRSCGEAEEELAKHFDPERDAAIVLGARDWHPGVLGIVASRLARKYHRPTIVVGFDSSGLGKGSGRSIEGLSLVEALGRCEKWLEKFGGHEMAAGLTVREENFPAFADAFRKAAREMLSDEKLQPRLHLDHELTFSAAQWRPAAMAPGAGTVRQRQSAADVFRARRSSRPSRRRF